MFALTGNMTGKRSEGHLPVNFQIENRYSSQNNFRRNENFFTYFLCYFKTDVKHGLVSLRAKKKGEFFPARRRTFSAFNRRAIDVYAGTQYRVYGTTPVGKRTCSYVTQELGI